MSARRPAHLLIIDPTVSLSSPAMRGVVLSLPELKARGMEIEVWCWECDPSLPLDKVVRLPRFGRLPVLGYYAFAFWAMLRALWLFKIQKVARPEIIYSVAWYLPACDVAHVHFSPWDWKERQRVLGLRSLRDLYERLVSEIALRWANFAIRITTARAVLCVSEAVAADIRAHQNKFAIKLLPNCYDPSRFNPTVREQHRDAMRKALKFAPEEKVFVFASTGHYRRKGFLLAVQALERLRKSHPSARFLVVGGKPQSLNRLQVQLDILHPGWREWVTFTGMVPDVERYFAAADGFLFPSYSEAFALVEVEAAACGLPLFLTRHHGSEMIPEDGRNGLFLEFDPGNIAAGLAKFVSGEWKPTPARIARLLDKATYAQLLAGELSSILTPC